MLTWPWRVWRRLPFIRDLPEKVQAWGFAWALLFFSGGLGTVVAQVTSVTGTNPVTCTPTTGNVVCTTVGSIPANQVLASPNGSSGNAGFRGLVASDLPLIASVQTYNIGWIATVNPNMSSAVILPTAITITSIIANIESAVGSAATVSVAGAPNQTPCSAATILHSGSINANTLDPSGAPGPNNQALTLTTTTVQAGSRLCLQSTGTGWATGSGVGTITIYATPSAAPAICTLTGSAIGSANGGQSCTSFTYTATGDSGNPTWTLSGGQIQRNGVTDPVTSGVTILFGLNGNIYQFNGTSWFRWSNAPTWPAGSTGYASVSADPR